MGHELRILRMRFQELSSEREDEDYKKKYTNVLKDSYIKKENFNFSHFRRKFHMFSCLKFCFKISKI